MNLELTPIAYRDVSGFPRYCVGSDGRVWARGRKRGTWEQVKPWKGKNGYWTVRLHYGEGFSHAGKSKRELVHRIVLESFVGPCPPGMQACHHDGNRTNNAIENLRWDTTKNNHADRERHGRVARGSRHGEAKLDEAAVEKIVHQLLLGRTGDSISKEFSVSFGTISLIRCGKIWRNVERHGLTQRWIKRKQKNEN